MKLSAGLLIASLFVLDASARMAHVERRHQVDSRQNGKNRQGAQGGNRFGQQGFGKGGQTGGGQGGNAGGAAAGAGAKASTTAATAAATSASAAATTTTAAAAANAGGKGNKGGAAAAAGAAGAAGGGATGAAGAAAAANSGGNNNNTNNGGGNDPQTSLTLDPSVIGSNTALTGNDPPVDGQADSDTSTNNFINFCVGKKLANGLQNKAGSCSPIPMGDIPAATKMVSAKFVSPANGDTLKANTDINVQLKVQNMVLGKFTNPQTTYQGAPQTLDPGSQLIVGHSHVTIEKLSSLSSTEPPDPTQFVFFVGLNDKDVNGVLSTTVTGGLPAGFYRISCINSAGNHQPVLMPVAQRGHENDMVYVTIE